MREKQDRNINKQKNHHHHDQHIEQFRPGPFFPRVDTIKIVFNDGVDFVLTNVWPDDKDGFVSTHCFPLVDVKALIKCVVNESKRVNIYSIVNEKETT